MTSLSLLLLSTIEEAVLSSDDEGRFWFKAIVPVPYSIPNDGPVGKLLGKLQRHCYRPNHMHFMFYHPV
jgi:protocatechuate 3,4-dioxygenase beta subunit